MILGLAYATGLSLAMVHGYRITGIEVIVPCLMALAAVVYDFSDESLLMADMKEVGPKGHFLGQESTLKKNKENWESALEDRNEFDRWMDLGAKTMGQRANEKVKDIIENGKLNTLPEELDAQIVAIIERIDKAEAEAMK